MTEMSELKIKTFHSVLWTVARVGGSNVLTFVVFAGLARLLSPAVFGVFALASAFSDFARAFATSGLADAVVQSKRFDGELADSLFWTNLVMGLVVGASTCTLAPIYARLVGQPEVAPVLEWLGALVAVSALGAIHMARKLREFGHRSVAARTIAGGLLGGGSAIFMAMRGFGVWSLVVQAAVNEVVGTIFAWRMFPWVPRMKLSWSRLFSVSAFSASMVLSQLLFSMLIRAQDVIIGSFLTASAVGVYRIAWRVIELISQATLFPVATVSVVTLSRLQDDRAGFVNAYGRMIGLAALFAFPAILGFGVLSEHFVAILFGPQWIASAHVDKILALMAPAYLLNFFIGPALAAMGRARAIMAIISVEVFATVVMSLIAAPFGLTAVTAAYVIATYVTMPYLMHVLKRETGVSLAVISGNVLPPLRASVFMVTTLVGVEAVMNHYDQSNIFQAAIGMAAGVVAYAVGLLLFARGFLTGQYRTIRAMRTRAAAKPTHAVVGPIPL